MTLEVKSEKELLGAMSEQFCNPDFSDVTLTVGETKYPAHRYVLALQSPVFRTMLTGGTWDEANQKEIHLKELCIASEEHFGEFLRFLYTGRIGLNDDNVFPLYQLSDKYDVASLNRDCSFFIKLALESRLKNDQCDYMATIAKSFHLVEEYAPTLLPRYIEAIRCNLWTLDNFWLRSSKDYSLGFLKLEHWKQILGEPYGSKVVAFNEMGLYFILHSWLIHTYESVESESMSKALQELLPLIRFYNMNANEINAVKKSAIGEAYADTLMKEPLDHAYKMQAELFAFSVTSPKKRKLSSGKVEHKCSDDNSVCEHVNPRLYVGKPYGKEMKGRLTVDQKSHHKHVNVVDLRSLQSYIKVLVGECNTPGDKLHSWSFRWVTKKATASGCVHERFDIIPSERDVGKLVTLVICVHSGDDKDAFQYTIVERHVVNTRTVLKWQVYSPERNKSKVEVSRQIKVNLAIYLHDNDNTSI